MKIIGLTGSIGMGKSTTAAMFGELGVPIWDADGAVHRLYDTGGKGVGPVSALFPSALRSDDSIDRNVLAKLVLNQPDLLKQLESVVHPLVGQDRAAFLASAVAAKSAIAMVDVPLLFETGGQAYVDKVIVVTCDPQLQRRRVLARPGMTIEKFEAILSRQTPDEQKRARADYIITTDIGLDDTRQQVAKIHRHLISPSSDTQQDLPRKPL